jgi:hypothetical protein
LKWLTVLALVCSSLGLAACGSSSSSDSTTAGDESVRIEALQLEKEKAEVEAETAKAEAKQESAEARREARQAAKKQVVRAEAEAEPSEPEPEPEEVPDVVGMRLPEAQSTLKAAGYRVQAENTDTAFGIVVPSHYTVCEQSGPHGEVVSVLAQKYGC